VIPKVAGTWKEMVLRWLFDQSVSTVLLIAILGAVGWGIPNYVLPSIREGYKNNSDSLRDTMKIYLEARDREMKLIMDSHDRDRQAFEKALEIVGRRP
jgi:hypothetical protein